MPQTDPVTQLRQVMLRDHPRTIGRPPDAHHYGGARLGPVVRLDTAIGRYLIVGVY